MKETRKLIGVAAALALAGFLGLLLVASCTKQAPTPKPPFLAHAEGNSNAPLIKAGDALFVSPFDYASLKPEMLAVFFTQYPEPRRMVSHWTVAKVGDAWITRGIGNPRNDDYRLTQAGYVGVVMFRGQLQTPGVLAMAR